MKRTLPFFAALLLLASVCSCNGGTNNGNASTDDENGYRYPELDMKGETVTVANMERIGDYQMNFVVDAENTSEPLNAAVYESNMRIGEEFNFTLVEDLSPCGAWETRWLDMGNYIIKNLNAGDDVFDFIFYPVGQRQELITRGYLHDLSDFEELQLDKPWWDTNINENIIINDRLYMASGSLNLMAYDGMTGLIFNKDLLNDNGLDSPYDMVRDGTWTLDALYNLASEVKTLNQDSNYWVLEGGTSVYGTGMHRDFPAHFFISSGIRFVTETNGDYNFSPESEDFYLALDKMQSLFTHCENGGVGGGDASSSSNSWMTLFENGRVGFAMIEVRHAFRLRDSDINYGFLPLPKLREEQENYITDTYEHLHFVAIPTTSGAPESVAVILDALAYDRYTNVVPVYYDSYITYKGVRDEDSLEMLEIMTATRTMDIGMVYGWCYELMVENISWNITDGTVSSMIATYEGEINETIDTFIENHLS